MADSGRRARAISEVMGYVFVFAIITSSIGVVYAVGFDSIDERRNYERANNAERAFDVFKSNMEDVTQRGAPTRVTEVKLADSALRTGDPVSIELTITNASDPSNSTTIAVDVLPIIYDTEGRNQIVYSNGAVFWQQDDESAMTRRSSIVLSEDRVFVPIVHTQSLVGDPLSKQSVAGSGTALIRAERKTSTVNFNNDHTESDVSLTITSPRAEAWHDHLTTVGPDGMNCPVQTATEVSCELTNVDVVHVGKTRIGVEFDN